MRPDPTYKTIFADPFMVEELMRWLVGDLHGAHELVDALDYSGLQRVHEQSVTSGTDGALHAYANDIVWRAPFHARREGDAGQRWLYLVVMVEFQSEVDYLMRCASATTPTTSTWSAGAASRSVPGTVWRRCCPSCCTGADRGGARRCGSSTW